MCQMIAVGQLDYVHGLTTIDIVLDWIKHVVYHVFLVC
jgi:hypothetical protein